MKRPDTPALLAAISFGGLQLAAFLALVPLAPNDALADSARLGEERAEAPLQDLGGLAANAPADAATADPGPAEAAPDDDAGSVPAEVLRDDILLLLAELPAPQAQAAVVTPPVPDVAAVVVDAPVDPAQADEPDMVDMILPTKAMGGY